MANFPQNIIMEAHRGPLIEQGSLLKGPSPLLCEFEGVHKWVLGFVIVAEPG